MQRIGSRSKIHDYPITIPKFIPNFAPFSGGDGVFSETGTKVTSCVEAFPGPWIFLLVIRKNE